jgi:hypothetical protein
MNKAPDFVLWVTLAVVGALVAPFLVGLLGFLVCLLVARISGDPGYMQWMWFVYVVAIVSTPVVFVGVMIAGVRSANRRSGR